MLVNMCGGGRQVSYWMAESRLNLSVVRMNQRQIGQLNRLEIYVDHHYDNHSLSLRSLPLFLLSSFSLFFLFCNRFLRSFSSSLSPSVLSSLLFTVMLLQFRSHTSSKCIFSCIPFIRAFPFLIHFPCPYIPFPMHSVSPCIPFLHAFLFLCIPFRQAFLFPMLSLSYAILFHAIIFSMNSFSHTFLFL